MTTTPRLVRTLAAVSAASALTFGVATTASATAPADEQEALDAVVEAFSERMIAAGWESQGPPDDAGDDEADPEFDVAFEECLGEDAVAFFEETFGDGTGFDGAEAESDEFAFALEATEATTDDFSFDIDDEETVSLMLLSLEAAEVAAADALIDMVGSGEFAACFTEAMQAQFAEEMGDEDTDFLGPLLENALMFDAWGEDDLGLGDNSALLGFWIEINFIVSASFEGSIYFVRTDDRLIGLIYARGGTAEGLEGDAPSGIDPIEELQQVIDDLDG